MKIIRVIVMIILFFCLQAAAKRTTNCISRSPQTVQEDRLGDMKLILKGC